MHDEIVNTITQKVAATEDVEVEQLPPLETVIETECLDPFKLDEYGVVMFLYCDRVVKITASGDVEIDPFLV